MRFWTNLLRRSSSRESIFVPRLPTNEEIVTMAVKRARKMERASRNLKLPFTPLDVGIAFYLDASEELWCDRALAETGLSQNDYSEETWEQIVSVFGVNAGLQEAAKARLRDGDYSGALGSWVKWVCTSRGLEGRPVDYVNKEDWLLLARIYIGLRCSSGARKALAWAKTAGDVEEREKDIPRQVWAYNKAAWEREIEDVCQGVNSLN